MDSATGELGVLIVDDDFRVARLHAAIVSAMQGFTVVSQAGTIAEARAEFAAAPRGTIDLALLDVYLPVPGSISSPSSLATASSSAPKPIARRSAWRPVTVH